LLLITTREKTCIIILSSYSGGVSCRVCGWVASQTVMRQQGTATTETFRSTKCARARTNTIHAMLLQEEEDEGRGVVEAVVSAVILH